jgi:hypothetical protein
LLKEIQQHYRQSHRVHQLLHRSMTAPTMKNKLALLRQVNAINETFDEKALPKWMRLSIDWYLGNIAPLLFPFGNPFSNFMLRWRGRLSRLLR